MSVNEQPHHVVAGMTPPGRDVQLSEIGAGDEVGDGRSRCALCAPAFRSLRTLDSLLPVAAAMARKLSPSAAHAAGLGVPTSREYLLDAAVPLRRSVDDVGSDHHVRGFVTTMALDLPDSADAFQRDWRFCVHCLGLWWNGASTNGWCPAPDAPIIDGRRSHTGPSWDFYLVADPAAEIDDTPR